MRSLEERFSDAITEVKRLGKEPGIEDVDVLRRVLDDLDHELRTTAHEPVERRELSKLSDQARGLLIHAHARARTALDIADAARRRELHALEHPTVLDPDPLPRNAYGHLSAPELDFDR
ncbi:hypothetical protein [Nocardia suismassiliense]|uniref:hypothetical protein n=1 Tax=Nocardia suismassiliense TaxID=2077092 RepID=UPI000D1F26C2|nr:hypothetical protein [Nocardia suismassiliense]